MSAPAGLEAPFKEPWEAQVFALVVALHERGLFTPQEWAQALGEAIRPEGGPEAPADYRAWLTTLEALLDARGLVTSAPLEARAQAFLRAAAATPHGRPILLENDPKNDCGRRA